MKQPENTTLTTGWYQQPVPCPTSEVELTHNNQIITSRLLPLVKAAFHNMPLCQHIVKHAGWSGTTFDCINWSTYEQAIKSYSRIKRLSIPKTAHRLNHTNHQAYMFYGTSSSCPCCQLHVENLSHVFTCPSEESAPN
jgi:hypothetical protein